MKVPQLLPATWDFMGKTFLVIYADGIAVPYSFLTPQEAEYCYYVVKNLINSPDFPK